MSCQTPFVFPCPKDPFEIADYQIDLTGYLSNDTISSFALTCTNVDLVDSAIDSTLKKINFRLQGGSNRARAAISLVATLASGQVVRRSAKLAIKAR